MKSKLGELRGHKVEPGMSHKFDKFSFCPVCSGDFKFKIFKPERLPLVGWIKP